MAKRIKAVITDVAKNDGYFEHRNSLIGKVGKIATTDDSDLDTNNLALQWTHCVNFESKKPIKILGLETTSTFYFLEVQVLILR